MWHTIPAVLFFFLALAFFFALESPPDVKDAATPAIIQSIAPALEVSPLSAEGAVLPLAMVQGKPILINFFASWCTPCLAEYPLIEQLGKCGDVLLYGIGWNDTAENLSAFLQKHGNPYSQVALDDAGRTAIAYGITGVPETFLLSPSHEIIYHQRGPLTEAIMQNELLPLLKKYEK